MGEESRTGYAYGAGVRRGVPDCVWCAPGGVSMNLGDPIRGGAGGVEVVIFQNPAARFYSLKYSIGRLVTYMFLFPRFCVCLFAAVYWIGRLAVHFMC